MFFAIFRLNEMQNCFNSHISSGFEANPILHCNKKLSFCRLTDFCGLTNRASERALPTIGSLAVTKTSITLGLKQNVSGGMWRYTSGSKGQVIKYFDKITFFAKTTKFDESQAEYESKIGRNRDQISAECSFMELAIRFVCKCTV